MVESRRALVGWLLLAAMLTHWSGPAAAVDGVIQINQAVAEAGGVTSADTPGFPVTIDQAGSYRLTSDLQVLDADTDVIEVKVSDVTVDLNGFAILGPTVCFPSILGGLSCDPTGTGSGVSIKGGDNLVVIGGTVRGMPDRGLQLAGRSRAERVRAISNGDTGIEVGPQGAVLHCTASQNGFRGIVVSHRALVTHSIANGNGDDGILTGIGSVVTHNAASENGSNADDPGEGKGIVAGSGSTVNQNTARSNSGGGIACGSGCTLRSNTATENNGNGIATANGSAVLGNTAASNQGFGLALGSTRSGYADNIVDLNVGGTVESGTDLGGNLCDGGVCP